MAELFDASFSPDDQPMSRAALQAAMLLCMRYFAADARELCEGKQIAYPPRIGEEVMAYFERSLQ
jgi:hypothetical protein